MKSHSASVELKCPAELYAETFLIDSCYSHEFTGDPFDQANGADVIGGEVNYHFKYGLKGFSLPA